jgi:hypothetical protein
MVLTYWRFRAICCLSLHGWNFGNVIWRLYGDLISETFYQNTRCHNQDDRKLYIYLCEKNKSHNTILYGEATLDHFLQDHTASHQTRIELNIQRSENLESHIIQLLFLQKLLFLLCSFSLVHKVNRRFGGTFMVQYWTHQEAYMNQAITSVSFYQTRRRHIPEDRDLECNTGTKLSPYFTFVKNLSL